MGPETHNNSSRNTLPITTAKEDECKQLGINKPFDGLGKDAKANFAVWQNEVRIASQVNEKFTPRRRDILMGKCDSTVTADNLQSHVTLTGFNEAKLYYRSKYMKDTSSHTIEEQQVQVNEDSLFVWRFLIQVTAGNIMTRIQSTPVEDVQKALTDLIESYGKTDAESVRAKMKQFKVGLASGSHRGDPVTMYADVPELVAILEKKRNDLVLLYSTLPSTNRVEEECLTDEYLSKITIDTLHSLYQPAIQKKRQSLHQYYMSIELTTNAQRKTEAEKGDAAWKEYPIPFAQLRALLADEYLHHSKIWEATRSSDRKVFAFNAQDRKQARSVHLHSKSSTEHKDTNTRCWDCNSCDCRFGDPHCTNKGALLNAPQFIKDKVERDGYEAVVKNGKPGRSEKSRANGGHKNGNWNRKSKKDVPCFAHLNGHCKHGNRCDFSHELARGSGTKNNPPARLDKRRRDKSARKIAVMVAKSLNKEDSTGGSSTAAKGKRDSRKLAQIDEYQALIMKAVPTNTVLMVNVQELPQVRLSAGIASSNEPKLDDSKSEPASAGSLIFPSTDAERRKFNVQLFGHEGDTYDGAANQTREELDRLDFMFRFGDEPRADFETSPTDPLFTSQFGDISLIDANEEDFMQDIDDIDPVELLEQCLRQVGAHDEILAIENDESVRIDELVRRSMMDTDDLLNPAFAPIYMARVTHNHGKLTPKKTSITPAPTIYGRGCVPRQTLSLPAFSPSTSMSDRAGYDSCAGGTISNKGYDFLTLDTSREARKSVKISGVGGAIECLGRGAMALTVHSSREGTFVLIDPHGILIAPAADGSALRVMSASAMENYGLFVHKTPVYDTEEETWSFVTELRDCHTDMKLPLSLSDGITVVNTVNRHARNYSGNKALMNHYLPLLRERRVSGLVHMNTLDHTIANARLQPRSKKVRVCLAKAATEDDMCCVLSEPGAKLTPGKHEQHVWELNVGKPHVDSAMEALMTSPLAQKQQLDVYHHKRKREFLDRITTVPLPTRRRDEILPESAYLPEFRIPPFAPEITDPIIDTDLQAFMVELDRCDGPPLLDSCVDRSINEPPVDFICQGKSPRISPSGPRYQKCPRSRTDTDTPRPVEDFV